MLVILDESIFMPVSCNLMRGGVPGYEFDGFAWREMTFRILSCL